MTIKDFNKKYSISVSYVASVIIDADIELDEDVNLSKDDLSMQSRNAEITDEYDQDDFTYTVEERKTGNIVANDLDEEKLKDFIEHTKNYER